MQDLQHTTITLSLHHL